MQKLLQSLFERQDSLRVELAESLRCEGEDLLRQWSKWQDHFPVLDLKQSELSLFRVLSEALSSPREQDPSSLEAFSLSQGPPPVDVRELVELQRADCQAKLRARLHMRKVQRVQNRVHRLEAEELQDSTDSKLLDEQQQREEERTRTLQGIFDTLGVGGGLVSSSTPSASSSPSSC